MFAKKRAGEEFAHPGSLTRLLGNPRGCLAERICLLLLCVLLFSIAAPVFAQTTEIGVTVLPMPSAVTIVVPAPSVIVGSNEQLNATATFNNGDPPLDVTASPLTNWQSGNPDVATVSPGGLVVPVSPGVTTIAATYGGVTTTTTITIIGVPGAAGSGGSGGNFPAASGVNPAPVNSSSSNLNPAAGQISPTSNQLQEVSSNPDGAPSSANPSADTPVINPFIAFKAAADTQTSAFSDESTPSSLQFFATNVAADALKSLSSAVVSALSAQNSGQTIVGQQILTKPLPADYQQIFGQNFFPADGVTRAEVVAKVFKKFHVQELKKNLIEACKNNLPDCLAIFASYSNYHELKLEKNAMQFYPDVPADYLLADAVNIGTMLGIVNGYYREPDNPFKPGQIISRVEALKVILGSTDILKWRYYDEFAAMLGGVAALQNQQTVFSDINSYNDHMWWYARYINVACKVQMIDCSPGSRFRPDDFIAKAEFANMLDRLQVYLIKNGIPPEDLTISTAAPDTFKEADFTQYDADKTNDKVAVWEKQYGITVRDGVTDSDHDGLSDKLEYAYGTDPLKADSDGDGFSDGQEVLQFHTNPLDALDPGRLENIGVRITGFSDGQILADPQPLVQGIAPAKSTVEVIVRNDFGYEKVLGTTTVEENNVFIFALPVALRDGNYIFIARALLPEKKQVLESPPVHVKIDTTLQVGLPQPKKLADQVLDDTVILKNVRVEVNDRRPVLYGKTEFGAKVTAIWRSVVATSALIADSGSGEFSIAPSGDLAYGNHEVYLQAVRAKDHALSRTVKVSFKIGAVFPAYARPVVKVVQTAKAVSAQVANFLGAVLSQISAGRGGLYLLGMIFLLGLLGGGVFMLLRKKKSGPAARDGRLERGGADHASGAGEGVDTDSRPSGGAGGS